MGTQKPSQRISEFETVETAVDDPERTVLSIDGVSKEYGRETAVEELSLSVKDGELLTLLGPSGCGKTTTLRMIAGLEEPSSGTISIAGETVTADADGPFRKPEERDVGIVFQDYALFPHLTVGENIAFGLDELDSDETDARVAELLELVDLEAHEAKMPSQLSGGQQQRVALARSLAPEPDVLLLDEPFSNLDVRLRVEMREEVRRILKRAGVTAISVTHDQEEALSISDRVAIMNDGDIAQVGNPGEVFENPESRFVASFLGQASFLSARVTDRLETGLGSFGLELLNGPIEAYDGAMIDVLVRPDDLQAMPTSEPKADGYVVHRQYNGPNFIYRVELHSGDVVHCMHNHVETFEAGQPVEVDLVADHELAWYPAE
ncbi:ABC transporter ATP-binding protein [Haloarcula salinisoli]|uniref:Molybdate/tungstate import ATP-binding protein WtpC n=1 Tax=Haloarcula salinisoli TaxID=2487746 RepID=A0A8J8C7C4_9EURY|nr:ABC transporter ATP-binding protein [Halomicroarcula salinisoli]MBX0285390.1 ABC transporter ATP-binding protein [Halomicroarcula salinisoli]MBX0303132.1 ABC transporter ATP-binding protein [Halomicroarcula salinisoli]